MELDSEEGHGVPVSGKKKGFELNFSHVSLLPNALTPLLRDLNSHIKPGEIIRLGSCNSASVQGFMQILLGYREDFSGTLSVNGVSIKSIN